MFLSNRISHPFRQTRKERLPLAWISALNKIPIGLGVLIHFSAGWAGGHTPAQLFIVSLFYREGWLREHQIP